MSCLMNVLARRSAALLSVIVVLFAVPTNAVAEEVDLLIVAGQSNAVGYNAKPGELPSDSADQKILFWWRCGDPPPDVHDSTSDHKWVPLQPQPLGNPNRSKQARQYGNFAQPEGGFGPEIGLARSIYAKERKQLAVVKVAFSGTGMKRDWNHADPGDGGACYRALVAETRTAIAAAKKQGIVLRPRALAWLQGESDASANDASNYAESLGAMLAAFRSDLDAPELIALIAVNTRFGGGRNPFVPTIVAQQKSLAAGNPRCEYVDTSSATIANRAHFDSKGTLEVGRLFAESLLRVEARLQPSQRHLTIVTLGDSITKGVRGGVTARQTYAALLETQLRGTGQSVRVINVGIGGERTDQALKRLNRIIALKPNIVTIMYGTNDSYIDRGKTASRITLDAYRSNLAKLVSELLRRGIQPVLMTEPRWADDARPNGLGENPNVRLEPYLVACREIATQWRVPLIDHFANWTRSREKGVKLREWTTDGCHPNPVGHRELTTAMLPVIQQAIGPKLKTRRKLLSGKPVRIVCFGDSVTGVYYHTGSQRAYTDMLGIALGRVSPKAKVKMINAGISGHTTVHALARIDDDVLSHKPDLVTIMFGLNDMVRVPLEQYRSNLKEIVAKCQAAGSEVVLATPNNVITTGNRPTEKLIQYCDVVRELGRELNVPVCDSYRELDATRAHNEFDWRLLMSDAIHPNMDGHKQLATAIAGTITGLRISLDDVRPPKPAFPKTLALLRDKKPVHIVAMPPLDGLIEPVLREFFPQAEIKVKSWPVAGLSLAKIEQDAKTRIRSKKPDLVLIAVPRSATAKSDLAFANSFRWIINWSLNFGSPTWDCVVVHPSVFNPNGKSNARDNLVRRIVSAQDLSLIDRQPGSSADAKSLLREWLQQQIKK